MVEPTSSQKTYEIDLSIKNSQNTLTVKRYGGFFLGVNYSDTFFYQSIKNSSVRGGSLEEINDLSNGDHIDLIKN